MSEQYGHTWRNVRDGAISYGNPAYWTLTAKDDWERVHVFNDAELAAHDREVKAEALRVASAQCSNVAFGSNADVAEWLLDRAASIESQETP